MARVRKAGSPEPLRITDAAPPLTADITKRQRRYLTAMLMRTACFVGAIIAGVSGVLWLAMILVLAAIVLPYVAVVMANGATPKGTEASPFGMTQSDRLRRLPSRHDR